MLKSFLGFLLVTTNMKEVKDIMKLVVRIILMEDIGNSFFPSQNENPCLTPKI
jgi:hypothetical protein